MPPAVAIRASKIKGCCTGHLAIQYRPVRAASETTYPRGISGHRMETFEYHPSVGWVGADVWFGRVAGYDRLELAGSTSWLDHTDAVGTITMQTDPTGADTWDATHYPWGQPWQQTGSHPTGGFYADLEFAINDPAIPSATREYNPYYYRWQTPDPGGRKVVNLDNPQTWNMYAYVGDNPTTFNDPSGKCLSCVIIGIAAGEAIVHALKVYFDVKTYEGEKQALIEDRQLAYTIADSPGNRATERINIGRLGQRMPMERARVDVTLVKAASDSLGLAKLLIALPTATSGGAGANAAGLIEKAVGAGIEGGTKAVKKEENNVLKESLHSGSRRSSSAKKCDPNVDSVGCGGH